MSENPRTLAECGQGVMRPPQSVMRQSDVTMEMSGHFHVIPLTVQTRLRFLFSFAAFLFLVCVASSQQKQSAADAKANESYAAGIAALKRQDLATARKEFQETTPVSTRWGSLRPSRINCML